MAENGQDELTVRYWLVRHTGGKVEIPLVPRSVAEQYEREGWATEPLLAAREIEGQMEEEDPERLKAIAAVIETHPDYIGAGEDAQALRSLASRVEGLGTVLQGAEAE